MISCLTSFLASSVRWLDGQLKPPVLETGAARFAEQDLLPDGTPGAGADAASSVPGVGHLTIDDPLAAAIREATKDPGARITCYITDRYFDDRRVFHLHSWNFPPEGPLETQWIEPSKDIERFLSWLETPSK